MTRILFPFSISCIILPFLWSCASIPKGQFGNQKLPEPDYAQEKYWAALPDVVDSADLVPIALWRDEQSTSPADVFFIYPTTYTGKSGQNQWNADVNDVNLNLRTDQYPIRYQASIFNGAGKIYAPRYRQAHLKCFYTIKKKEDAAKALDFAYQDVRKAFQYYLDHYNEGRPFIIAAHSQGTFHAGRLLGEMIDDQPLQSRMIAAYLPGLPVPGDLYKTIKPCSKPDETGCFCSWRTVREGAVPPALHFPGKNIVVTNPVTWDADQMTASPEVQKGAILRDFQTLMPNLVSTKVHEDLLWVSKPRFPGSFLLVTKNYHIADYNFFYADVRRNAQDRVRAYLDKH